MKLSGMMLVIIPTSFCIIFVCSFIRKKRQMVEADEKGTAVA